MSTDSEERFYASLFASAEYFDLKAPAFTRGQEISALLGTFTTDGPPNLDLERVRIRWGDGKSSRSTLVSTGASSNEFAVFGAHRYRSTGRFRVILRSVEGARGQARITVRR